MDGNVWAVTGTGKGKQAKVSGGYVCVLAEVTVHCRTAVPPCGIRKRAAGGQPLALAIIRGVRAVAARLNYADKLLGIFAVGCISVLGLVF